MKFSQLRKYSLLLHSAFISEQKLLQNYSIRFGAASQNDWLCHQLFFDLIIVGYLALTPRQLVRYYD